MSNPGRLEIGLDVYEVCGKSGKAGELEARVKPDEEWYHIIHICTYDMVLPNRKVVEQRSTRFVLSLFRYFYFYINLYLSSLLSNQYLSTR